MRRPSRRRSVSGRVRVHHVWLLLDRFAAVMLTHRVARGWANPFARIAGPRSITGGYQQIAPSHGHRCPPGEIVVPAGESSVRPWPDQELDVHASRLDTTSHHVRGGSPSCAVAVATAATDGGDRADRHGPCAVNRCGDVCRRSTSRRASRSPRARLVARAPRSPAGWYCSNAFSRAAMGVTVKPPAGPMPSPCCRPTSIIWPATVDGLEQCQDLAEPNTKRCKARNFQQEASIDYTADGSSQAGAIPVIGTIYRAAEYLEPTVSLH